MAVLGARQFHNRTKQKIKAETVFFGSARKKEKASMYSELNGMWHSQTPNRYFITNIARFVNVHHASGRASTEYHIPLTRCGNTASLSCGRLERSRAREQSSDPISFGRQTARLQWLSQCQSIYVLLVITYASAWATFYAMLTLENCLMGCDNVPRCPADIHRRFRRNCSLHIQI